MTIEDHPVVSHEAWLAARKQLLLEEKEFTRLRDKLSERRRELPWELVDKDYVFEGRGGKQTLAQLFGGRSQLVVYHFMFDPAWDAGCPHCSFWADNFDRIITHLNQRDLTMVAVSLAPLAKLLAYQQRMGWSFDWLSSHGTEFNRDYRVSFTAEEVAAERGDYNYAIQNPQATEREAVSVFYQDAAGRIFHTYSAYARGIDMVNAAYHYLDLAPKGRDEGGHGPYWVRRHDEY